MSVRKLGFILSCMASMVAIAACGGNETQITEDGISAGGGAFMGVYAYLTGTNAVSNASASTLYGWTEKYDVGSMRPDSGTNDELSRFTFGATGHYEIKIQQEWVADAAGYREMSIVYRDVSGSSNNTILRDRMDGSSDATLSGSSTTFYVDDESDYITVNVYQNSGATLNLLGNNDDSTVITINRIVTSTPTSQQP